MPPSRDVTVVGAGVIGLTTAVRLIERGFNVEVVADRRQPDTTSNVAAGLWYPYKAGGERVARWALKTLDVYCSPATDSHTGVRMTPGVSFVPADQPRPFWADADVNYRDLSLPDPSGGLRSRSVSVCLPVAQSGPMMIWLENRFQSLGGSIQRLDRSLTDLSGLDVPIIVNCTGLGARELCGDDSVVPIRGVVVRMADTGIDRFTTDDVDPDTPTYIIPGDGFCVLGGSADTDRWELSVSNDEVQDIIERCARLDHRVRDGKIIGVAAGLRPGRREVRLESEELDGRRTIVHNYGHGGSGFTLAWGCAEEVAGMLKTLNAKR